MVAVSLKNAEDAVPDVVAAVEEASRAFAPFDLRLAGLGAFPSPRKARVVWVGVEDGREQLIKLASAVELKLAELNFEPEERDFKAHITIGRVKESRFLGRLADGIGEIDASDLGTQRVTSVTVMQSELQREGSVYSPLKVLCFPGVCPEA